MVLEYVLASTIAVSAFSFVGVKERFFNKRILSFVSFATGALLAVAFLDLIPEAAEEVGKIAFGLVLFGVLLFFIMEKMIYWYHCHKRKCGVHTFTYLNLAGDSIHNFVDGVIIASSFLASIPLGLATTVAVIAHEIPQEMSAFAILVYGGFSRQRALAFNFLSALAAIAGALFAYFFAQQTAQFSVFVLPVAAGGFIYIAGADLLPELHRQAEPKTTVTQALLILFGIAVVWSVTLFFA